MFMSFYRKREDILKIRENKESADFGSAEMVNVFWLTKPEIIKKILPPPLEPPSLALAHGFIANYPETNFGLPYTESALFVRCQFQGEMGNYCLAMHLDGPGKDMAMASGREYFGFPKKISTIKFNLEETHFEGFSERHGVKNISFTATFQGKFNSQETSKLLVESGLIPGKLKNPASATFNYKFFPDPEGEFFDYKPRLVKQVTVFRPSMMKIGRILSELELGSSLHDPWGEIEVVKTLAAIYQEGNNSIQIGKVVAEIDPGDFLPYSFLKWDWF